MRAGQGGRAGGVKSRSDLLLLNAGFATGADDPLKARLQQKETARRQFATQLATVVLAIESSHFRTTIFIQTIGV